MLPRGRWRWRGDEFFQDISGTLAAYTRAQLTACLFIGVVCSRFCFPGNSQPAGVGFDRRDLLNSCRSLDPCWSEAGGAWPLLHGGPFWALLVRRCFWRWCELFRTTFIYPRADRPGHSPSSARRDHRDSVWRRAGRHRWNFSGDSRRRVLTVSYRHWLEHRGSEGLADVLEPTSPADSERASTQPCSIAGLRLGEANTEKPATQHPNPELRLLLRWPARAPTSQRAN